MRFQVSKFARDAATTFAPRPSGATKNPAYKGSLLYTIFEVQAYVCLVVSDFHLSMSQVLHARPALQQQQLHCMWRLIDDGGLLCKSATECCRAW